MSYPASMPGPRYEAPTTEKLPEFIPVRLLKDVFFHGTMFPTGTVGVIVDAHPGGVLYEVEFSSPAEEVVGVYRDDLHPV